MQTVTSIVRTAASYPGGLAELLRLVQLAEGPSTAWQRVEEYSRAPWAT